MRPQLVPDDLWLGIKMFKNIFENDKQWLSKADSSLIPKIIILTLRITNM